MCEVSQVDRDGDLVIILSVTGEPCAPWDPDVALSGQRIDSLTVQSETLTGQDHKNPIPASKWRFKISSKHLILASQRFKKLLTGDWSEATTVYPDGSRHVDLKHGNFDPQALQIDLHVIDPKTAWDRDGRLSLSSLV